MIYRIVLMLSLYRLLLGQDGGIERIQKCETRCSKGLQCKSKLHHYFAPCQSHSSGLTTVATFQNVSLSTVMRCERRQNCSLHLRAHIAFQLSEHIHGFSICTLTVGMILNQCRLVTFPKSSRQRRNGQQVEIQDDFSEVWPSQDVHVTLKTYPSYCGVTWSSTYHVPECSSNDLRSNVPECITGRLAYTVNPERKELVVSVSDMLENKDYQLRLCKKGQYICKDTGANTMIKKEDLLKRATLKYSTPLPCLCMEGWSAISDAPRVQVCPFKDRLEELWAGITYDPMEATLSWEPMCPVAAVISLCQKQVDNECEDLSGSLKILNGEKITFSGVDPHPQLCVKFTTDSGSWIRCPFAGGNFQAWELSVEQREGEPRLVVTSRVKSPLYLHVRVMAGTSAVHTLQVYVENSVTLNLTVNLCQPNTCLQVKRLHVKYGATILHCHLKCSVQTDAGVPAPARVDRPVALHGYWKFTLVVISAVALISVVMVTALLGHMLIVHQKKREDGVCVLKRTEPPLTVYHVSQDHKILVPNTPPFKISEKVNLLK